MTENADNTPKRRGHVLMVDDDNDLLTVVQLILGQSDIDVDVASEAETAIRKLRQTRYDAVIMDNNLDGSELNGLELATLMRSGQLGEEVQRVPIVFSSASTRACQQATLIGGSIYAFPTPWYIRDLLNLMGEILSCKS